MGTSQSSTGPNSGVPLVPPWADDPLDGQPASEGDGATDTGNDSDDSENNPDTSTPPAVPSPIAPKARFSGARRALNEFASSGDSHQMRRGMGHYVRKGYGGAATTTRRMGGTASTANALHSALAGIAAGHPVLSGSLLDPVLLAGRSVREVMDAVVEAVRPINGTQDAEASRSAIRDSLSDLLTQFPDADLLNLDEGQRGFVIERYTALDIFKRFDLDVGKTIRDHSPTAETALSRLKQARDYVKETVSASFRKLRDDGRSITEGQVKQIVRDALRETFRVFEGYTQ